ncbi:MAG: preprotein translocase subunit SecA [Neisseriales bacterium]|nr:MAG: preprotein translocase subunit SecA [Neisseriales bacterium]
MFLTLLKKVFGSRNERLLKIYHAVVAQINAMESGMQQLSDEELSHKTTDLREALANGKTLDAILPEAFAVCREASRRVLGLRHFDVQLIGGIALHDGKIAEMRTGEGKTLVATLAVYLNALSGNGVHVITVNDYLASRDAATLEPLYNFLGLTVGVNLSQIPHHLKKVAYTADITYGTNNEFGFDYLRDNMVFKPSDQVQRPLEFAVVDEVDSILIDEARTPLIISGSSEDNIALYERMNKLPSQLKRQATEDDKGDYWVDEQSRNVLLSEAGHERCEAILSKMGLIGKGSSLYSVANLGLMHHVMLALKAHCLFHVDQHYVKRDNEIVIVDEFTGRLMPGRRWGDGLHQAIEAKEGVTINRENQTLASITFQNYFRLYHKLAGMTGTADTEAYEFQQIYGLETVVIPTNQPMIRQDFQDQVYRTAQEKYQAIIDAIKICHDKGQPVLVGTTNIENSELISQLLNQANLKHNILNAKEHEREAEIVTQAGRLQMITVATNMAGRGTDIVLGGNPAADIKLIEQNTVLSASERDERIAQIKSKWEVAHQAVIAAGGLHIIGTERHESRRIDNQLRGRSGRQGDPGSSRFYLSLEDPLLRIFASDRVATIMQSLKMPKGEAIEHPWVTRALENAQKKVEGRNFDIRKQLIEYDDVINDQRKVIYQQRKAILNEDRIQSITAQMREDVLSDVVRTHMSPDVIDEQWNLPLLEKTLQMEYGLSAPVTTWLKETPELDTEQITKKVLSMALQHYQQKIQLIGQEAMDCFERYLLLQTLDTHWREHIATIEHLRRGIHLRGYAQKHPKQEYKREAFELFGTMLDSIKSHVVGVLLSVEFNTEQDIKAIQPSHNQPLQLVHDESDSLLEEVAQPAEATQPAKHSPIVRTDPRIGRNESCPCGSGKKYKHCHGKLY